MNEIFRVLLAWGLSMLVFAVLAFSLFSPKAVENLLYRKNYTQAQAGFFLSRMRTVVLFSALVTTVAAVLELTGLGAWLGWGLDAWSAGMVCFFSLLLAAAFLSVFAKKKRPAD